MFVITSKNNNVVVDYFDEIVYLENGYPMNKKGRMSYIPSEVNVYEVEVPEGVIYAKYCYTPEAGFFENPDYTQPSKYGIPDELVQQIQDDTVADLIELGVL